MPVRRLNYTHRKRIVREDVHVRVSHVEGRAPSFDADLHLDTYKLPAEALVFLEARRQTRFMRFALGTVGEITIPSERTLSAFDSIDGVLFRIVVSSAGPHRGLIVAEADQVPPITPESAGKRIPLLPVQGDANLGQRVWRLDFTNGPLLLINRNGVEWKTLAAEPSFQSLVYPAIVREVLGRAFAEGGGETDPPTEWRGYWLAFGEALVPDAPVPEDIQNWETVDDWIESVVVAFSQRHELFTKFLGTIVEEA